MKDLAKQIQAQLKTFGYKVVEIRLSELLEKNYVARTKPSENDEFARLTNLQKMCSAFRESSKDGAALARAAISEIRKYRLSEIGNPDTSLDATAFILHQLKHPEEVELLRRVYGPAFKLIAGHAPRTVRVAALAARMAQVDLKSGEELKYQGRAENVISDDDKHDSDFGQNTRDTFPKADFFVNIGIPHGEMRVHRFVDLLFGHPFHTPTPEEYAMYQASAVSLRSSDDSRQVGAAIVSLARNSSNPNRITNADVIAVGANEVPRGGGGFYWDGDSPDYRDQALMQNDDDRPRAIKTGALSELIARMRSKAWLSDIAAASDDNMLASDLLASLKGTQFMNMGEFSRPVHAEMAALIDSARRGVAVNGHTMFVTTFPCHNCAKHIIASGIRSVVYLEPYFKSRAALLYGEELVFEAIDGKEVDGKVVFSAFAGVGPRQYQQMFSMSERGAKNGLPLSSWTATRTELSPRCIPRNAASQFMVDERLELKSLDPKLYSWKSRELCPD